MNYPALFILLFLILRACSPILVYGMEIPEKKLNPPEVFTITTTPTLIPTGTPTPTTISTFILTVTPTIEPTPKKTVYVVKPGDTMIGIANKFGADIHALAWENGLPNLDLIDAGARASS